MRKVSGILEAAIEGRMPRTEEAFDNWYKKWVKFRFLQCMSLDMTWHVLLRSNLNSASLLVPEGSKGPAATMISRAMPSASHPDIPSSSQTAFASTFMEIQMDMDETSSHVHLVKDKVRNDHLATIKAVRGIGKSLALERSAPSRWSVQPRKELRDIDLAVDTAWIGTQQKEIKEITDSHGQIRKLRTSVNVLVEHQREEVKLQLFEQEQMPNRIQREGPSQRAAFPLYVQEQSRGPHNASSWYLQRCTHRRAKSVGTKSKQADVIKNQCFVTICLYSNIYFSTTNAYNHFK
jgi:hypothetical protein